MNILFADYFEKSGQEAWIKAAERLGVCLSFVTWRKLLTDTNKEKPVYFSSPPLAGKKRQPFRQRRTLPLCGRGGCHFKHLNLEGFDLLYIRTIRDSYCEMVQLVSQAARLGIPVVDRSLAAGSRVSDGKAFQMLRLASSGIPVPRTIIAQKDVLSKNLDEFLARPVILKLGNKHRGNGVFLVESSSEVDELIGKNPDKESFLLQERIEYRSDLRILVVGGKVLGAIERVPQKGEFRANIARGGQAKAIKVTKVLEGIALKSVELLEYDIAGVDVLLDGRREPFVTEVNRAPQFRGFEEVTGIDVRSKILSFLAARALQKHP